MNKTLDLLVVEDEPVVLSAIKRIIEPENITMEEAVDADSAIDKLNQFSFNLVISDLMLPKKSAFELIIDIKKIRPHCPIIVISGYATIETMLRSFKLGAFDFIAKPFDTEAFLGVVHRGLKYSRERLGNPDYSPDCIPGPSFEGKNKEPLGLYCLGGHACIKILEDGAAEIGVGETFPHMIENLERVEILSHSDEIIMGKCCVRFWTKKGMMNMFWAPISGKVIAVNHKVEENPEMLNNAPYNQGWLLRIIPNNLEDELKHLNCCFRKKV